ncbi:MAG: sialate O-acetylesterase [Treponema sp.]|nr:sialate O-acetylesterase [Treponema sp.]MCI7565319.1 sialate O-acetylesterase [Treponema sp.]
MKGELCVKGIVASGMVLQRNKINCIYGTADVYEDVIMTFRGVTSITQADEQGYWKLEFSPGEAGGPFEMQVKTEKETLTFTEVYVGEVWLLSGQSNAQLPMERMRFSYAEEFELPENPNIRMITIPIAWTFDGERDYVENPQWICASPETLGQMSGTGYFFAKRLAFELGVPVGIINASQGGSPIASWMSKKSLEEMGAEEYLSKLEYYEKVENIAEKQKEMSESNMAWNNELNAASKMPDFESDQGWETIKIPGIIENFDSAGYVWLKKEIELTQEQVDIFEGQKTWLWMGTIIDSDRTYINGTEVGFTAYLYPPRRYVVPKGVLKVGKNIISMHVLKNSKKGKIRFYEEKPYCLFTDNVYVNPVACRNLEKHTQSLFPLDGEEIDLTGEWKMMVDVKVRDCPPGMFFEWLPTALYNAMLAPCFKTAISGAVWYQGESDTGHPVEYKNMLIKMINLWRHKFVYGSKDLPFVIVQLPNWSDGVGEDSCCAPMGWPYLRQAQSEAARAAGNAGLAVTIDAGEWNDLHPEKKQTAGKRAALEALRVAYGKSYISAAPRVTKVVANKAKCLVHFDCGNSSLVAHQVNGKAAELDHEAKDKKVQGFSCLFITKGKMNTVAAQAKLISDYDVEVSIPRGQGALIELHYLWGDNPAPVNLYSRDLLPAAPFNINLEE